MVNSAKGMYDSYSFFPNLLTFIHEKMMVEIAFCPVSVDFGRVLGTIMIEHMDLRAI